MLITHIDFSRGTSASHIIIRETSEALDRFRKTLRPSCKLYYTILYYTILKYFYITSYNALFYYKTLFCPTMYYEKSTWKARGLSCHYVFIYVCMYVCIY